MNIIHIAVNTFREAAREKVLYIIFFFAVAMVGASQAIGWISVGQQVQVVKHFSLAIISFFGALISVFVGTSLIYKETDKRTIYTILSKPVERWEFVVGKFLGLLAILFCIVMAMGLMVSGFISIVLGGEINAIFIEAIVLIFFELMVVTAIAMMFSTASSPIISAVFTFCAYLIGQVTDSLISIVNFRPLTEDQYSGEVVDNLTWFMSISHSLLKPVSQFLYVILPNLSHFSLRNRVVYGPELKDGEFSGAVFYALFYSAAVLIIAVMSFRKKRF